MLLFLLTFGVSALSTLLLVRSSNSHARFSADADFGGPQKFHVRAVPRIGGIGIAIGLVAGVVAVILLYSLLQMFRAADPVVLARTIKIGGGIVTLAAAFALPENFPYRDLMLLTAFAVVLGSLVIQGLTLRPLISALRLKDDNPVASEVARARAIAYRAALDEIDSDPSEAAELLRIEYRAVLTQAEGNPDGGVSVSELPADPLRRRAIGAARRAILQLREAEDIGDDAFHQLEEELDRAELNAGG